MDDPSRMYQIVMVASFIFKYWGAILLLIFGFLFYRANARRFGGSGLSRFLSGRRGLRSIYRVVDGDSLEVVTLKGAAERVRLIGIDAPEYHTQPYGREARAALDQVVRMRDGLGRPAELTIERAGKDRYGRTLARLWCGKVCVNSWMIANGHAWAEPGNLANILSMSQARLARRGLWALPSPVRPSIWRKAHM